MKKNMWFSILISAVSVGLVAAVAGLFSSFNHDWYDGLNKSVLTPADFVFSVVWGVLYAAMAVGLFFAMSKGLTLKSILLYAANGLLNVLWCLCFFTLKQPGAAFFVLILNVIAAFLLLFELKKFSPVSFYICIAYCLWLSYALILNYFIIMLN